MYHHVASQQDLHGGTTDPLLTLHCVLLRVAPVQLLLVGPAHLVRTDPRLRQLIK